jgi:hypothetical protein
MAGQNVHLIRFIHAALFVLVRFVDINQRLKLLRDERFVKSHWQGRRFMHATEACQANPTRCRDSSGS